MYSTYDSRWLPIRLEYVGITADCDLDEGWTASQLDRIYRKANPVAAAVLELIRYWTACRVNRQGPGEHWLRESTQAFVSNLFGLATSRNTIRAAIENLEERGFISVRRSDIHPHEFRFNTEQVEKAVEIWKRSELDRSLTGEVLVSSPCTPPSDLTPSLLELESREDFFDDQGVKFNPVNPDQGGVKFNQGGVKNDHKYKSLVSNQEDLILPTCASARGGGLKTSTDSQEASTPLPPKATDSLRGDQPSQPQAPSISGRQQGFATPEQPLRYSVDAYAATGIKHPAIRFEERFQGKNKRDYYWLSEDGNTQFHPDLLSVWVSEDPESWVGDDGVVALGRLRTNLSDRVRKHDFSRLDATWEAVEHRRRLGVALKSVYEVWEAPKTRKPKSTSGSAPKFSSSGGRSPSEADMKARLREAVSQRTMQSTSF